MKIILTILIFLITVVVLFSQNIDSLGVVPPDSLILPSDTTAVKDSAAGKRYDVDTTIFANASDSIIFLIDKKEMQIYGSGELEYKQTQLKSSNIYVDFETSDVTAVGIPSDTIPDKLMGTPVLNEKGEVYEGKSMKYNFKTGRGLIAAAETETEGSFYTGAKINKVDKDTYFIEDGVFTTCDDSVPHYYFYSPEMKVTHKEQIVAKWIWLFFSDVPFPVPLPFAVFPIESGRRSGILPPAFGQDNFGYYFSKFGYFWAISDYMDLNLTANYWTRGSYNLGSRYRYAKRYNFAGNFEGSYLFRRGSGSESGSEPEDPGYGENIEWRLRWFHNQDIDPTLKFNTNLEFLSGSKYLNSNVADLQQNLRGSITSTANITKTWDESGNSLSASYTRNQELSKGNITEILPQISFRINQKYPFRSENSTGANEDWYEMIGFSYNTQLRNNRDKTDGDLKIRGGIQHNISINASPKVGYVSITPNISYQEKWYNKKTILESGVNPVTGNDTILSRDVHQINMLRTFSFGMSAQTRFFGIFNPNMLGIASFRHTVTPSISYNYTPDFSKPLWGYYESYIDTNGNSVRYDPFSREIYSGVSAYESQAINFSLGNDFEMKTRVDPTDTTSKEEKIKLLRLTANISYDFTRPDFKLSDLSLNYNTSIGQWFSLAGSTVFSPYDYNTEGNRINEFLINNGKGILRLTNFQFSVSTSLSGEKLTSKDDQNPEEGYDDDEFQLSNSNRDINRGLYEDREADFTIPWNLSLNYHFTQNQSNPYRKSVLSTVSGSFDFNLTPAWKLSFTGSYDIKSKEFAAPQVMISRDLHCWVMNFTWNPIGTFRGYRFEIRVKASQLQDLKITKRDDFYSGK